MAVYGRQWTVNGGRRGRIALLLLFCLLSAVHRPPAARAACSSPAGNAGEIVYNADWNMMQYCDGDDKWIRMSTGYLPGAVNFDGTNDYLALGGDLAGITQSTRFTVSFWYRNGDSSGIQIIAAGNGSPSEFVIQENASDEIDIFARNAADAIVYDAVSSVVLTDSNWHHVLISVDLPGNKEHLYIDGVSALTHQTLDTSGVIDLNFEFDNMGVGGSSGGANKFSGDLADLWIDFNSYIDLSDPDNRAKFISPEGKPQFLGNDGSLPAGSAPDIFLSGPEPAWHTNKGTGGGFTENGALAEALTNPVFSSAGDYTSNLVGHWKLDEITFVSAADSSGNGNNGSLLNGLNPVNDAATGVRNGALEFDGANDTIHVNDPGAGSVFDLAGDYTLSAWVKYDNIASSGANSYPRILQKGSAIASAVWYLGVDGGANLCPAARVVEFALKFSAVWDRNCGSIALETNRWYHIAVTRSGVTGKIYINGVLDASPAVASAANPDANDNVLTVGSSNDSDGRTDGTIDDVRVYNRALSANDVKALYMNSPRYCSSPDGAAGEMHYNADTHQMMFCPGGGWLSMDGRYRPNAVTFDGSDYMSGTLSASDTTQVTISFWYKRDVLSGIDAYLDLTAPDFDLNQSATNMSVVFANSADADVLALTTTYSAVLDTTAWHHFMLSFDLTNTAKRHLYIDGVSVTPSWNTYNTSGVIDVDASPYYIGTNDSLADDLQGSVADFWIDFGTYMDLSVAANRAKFIDANGRPVYLGADGSLPTGAAPEIFLSGATSTWHTNKGTGGGFTMNGALSDAATSPLDPPVSLLRGLIAHWRMDETTGTSVVDMVAGLTGAITGGVALGSGGKVGSAADFDGSSGYIDMPFSGLPTGDFTYSFWGNFNAVNDEFIIMASNGAGNNELLIYLYNGKTQVALDGSGIQGTAAIEGATTLSASQWYHITVTRSGDVVKIYINASEDESASGHGAALGFSNCSLLIGVDNDTSGCEDSLGNYTDGLIDDIRIYNRALSAAEVTALYNATNAGKVYPDVCANPDGVEGEMIYNATEKVMQFCNGGYWVGVGK